MGTIGVRRTGRAASATIGWVAGGAMLDAGKARQLLLMLLYDG